MQYYAKNSCITRIIRYTFSNELQSLIKLLNCHEIYVIHKNYNTTRKMLQNNLKCSLMKSFVSEVVYKINSFNDLYLRVLIN